MTSFAHPFFDFLRHARVRRRLGVSLQAAGWLCGLLVVLGAPFMPLVALLLVPVFGWMGFEETNAAVMVAAMAALFVLLPVALCLVHIGGELRTTPSLDNTCIRCGYDLRGSTHSQRCPECGAGI